MACLRQNDCDIYYELSGNGPPILFIQGVGVTGEGWRPQADELATVFRCLLYDNRGIGRSVPCRGPITIETMAMDARSLLDAAGWESAHVVGHSMGGVIAQQFALDAPKRIRSLSLACTFARGRDAARPTPWVLWMTLRTRLGSRRARRRAFLEMLYPKAALDHSDRDALAARVASLIGRDLADSPPILLRQLRALARHDVSARLRELAGIPTLVLSAGHDRIALPEYGKRLAAMIPGAQFELVPNASHGLPIHQVDWVNERLRSFIAGVEQTRHVQSMGSRASAL